MSSMFVERAHVVTAGFAVAVAYLVSPVAAKAATCDLTPRSLDCVSGATKMGASAPAPLAKGIKVASIAPAATANDASADAAATSQGKSGKRQARASSRGSKSSATRQGWRTRVGGFQARGGVNTGCFPSRLRALLTQVASRYGRRPVITSGYRSPAHNRRIGGARESQHLHCNAADFFIPGVNPGALASFLKAMPGRGGVGTYCGNRTVHLDVGPRREWHWGCGRSHYASRSSYRGRHTSRVMRRYAAARSRSGWGL